jgi:hypothetical protein
VLPTERTADMKCPEVTARFPQIDLQMAEDTLKAKHKVHRGRLQAALTRKICNIECEIDP